MMHDNDLEFVTEVDGKVIPPPSAQPTNNVLANMKAGGVAGGSSLNNNSGSNAPSYTPGSSLPLGASFNQSAHPTACLFHILFKGSAFTVYMLGSKAMEGIMVTVLCILLLAADFWVVKNITGRLLVGLRWWNKVDPVTGQTSWIFESASPTSPDGTNATTNSFDSKFFWTILYVTPILWALCFMSAILWLRFNCFVTLAIALVLSFSNVYGYYKCSADQRAKLNEMFNAGAEMGMRAMIRNNVFGRLGGMFSGGNAQQQQQGATPQFHPGTFA
eukprot:CAMPEP_0201697452 /NCGR_PEP_ID=MMETSP0578-20130828/11325_1 /ASSEMBLY_ACC=CAM_ASM_000663 /TAXON_ID=267565 /ORGANISM="Skeletonema grethea, Strain CCMP 1804" /LENGTH=273 /DNA_ID=CAMNT_0048183631 /DNA_START=24 /DNA_END=845 /DNA_ORIENTATION=+